MDVRRDTRILSLVGKAGMKGNLTNMLDQLQRCQKALNEFLEVCFNALLGLAQIQRYWTIFWFRQ